MMTSYETFSGSKEYLSDWLVLGLGVKAELGGTSEEIKSDNPNFVYRGPERL